MIEAIVVSALVAALIGLAAEYNWRASWRAEREATSAATGRECGGPSREVANARQPVIGFPRGGCNSTARASRQLSEVGTFKGVPIFAYDRFAVEGEREL